MGDDARRTILNRRARFVAAALAGLGAAAPACGGGTDGEGSSFDGGADRYVQPPQPCLTQAIPPPQPNDAGGDAPSDADASDAADAEDAG